MSAVATAGSSRIGALRGRRAVGWWLMAVALIVVGMVMIGGLTRLTGSGLSITEWHPVTGAIPPLNDQAWQQEFAKYRNIPQYLLANRGMSLAEFKTIYWWEWTHRFLGRLLGFAFFLPFVWFAWTGAIARKEWPRMVLLFGLFLLQAFIGWWMVKSGLQTRVSVSQYRLAIHLGAAILLFGALLWTAFGYLRAQAAQIKPNALAKWSAGYAALVYVQMLLGALVAGLHAGLVYNTWPSMDGRVLPENPFFQSPWWINFFEDPGLVQFDHRMGAYAAALLASFLWFWSRRSSASAVRTGGKLVLGVTALQILLGILTLLHQVPLVLAAMHQLTATALFAAAVWLAFEARQAAAKA